MNQKIFTSSLACVVTLFCCMVPAARSNDKVRVETRVDLAVQTFGVSGQGVIVAILDRGIDWRHDDFRNNDGSTRIEYIFDLTDDSGAQGNPYGMGTLYTKAQINSALQGGPTLATRDAVGHGTSTAGIACGNGRSLPSQKYRGMAPNATIIIVKITSEGAPAHDNEPAEDPFFDPTRIPVAIDFVVDKATELGLPCVMLLNLGSQAGPTDGTSELARKINSTVGPGIPGLVFVTGTGDDGGMANRAGGFVTSGQSVQIQIQKTSTGSLFFDLWYPGDERFDVAVQTPSGNFGPFASPETNDDSEVMSEQDFLYYQLGANVDFYNATNQKREIWIRFDGPPGDYVVELEGAVVVDGRFDVTLNPSQVGHPDFNSNVFLNFVAPGSIWDGATAFYNVAPNSYVFRTSWIDIDGISRNLVGEGEEGEIWTGSSIGPTFDGRLGVDVSAPGDRIVTSYGPKSYWATFRWNLIEDGNGLYGMAGAVSAAAPVATGIIALMLELNSQLDAATVKQILQQTARSDQFTGGVPNTTWGYGKIDAFAALQEIAGQPGPAFFDDFEDAVANGWTPLNPSRWSVVQDQGDFSYFLNTTDYSANGDALGEFTVIDNNIFDDFTFTCQARSAEDLASNQSADFDIVFGFQDASNYYYAMFNSNPDFTEIFKVVNGTRISLDNYGVSAIIDNDYHTIEVKRNGTLIEVKFDNVLIMSATDGTFTGGKIAVGGFNDSGYFDDIQINHEGGGVVTGLVFRVERSTGDVFAAGAFIPNGADLAERINVSEFVEPGDVVELDPEKPEHYRKARGSSRLLAGIITTEPGFILGNRLDQIVSTTNLAAQIYSDLEAANRPMLALMGRVPVKANTENGPIRPGDLLTVSSKPGYAMRCANAKDCNGAIIGKALEGLVTEEGMILVLVMTP